MHFNDGIVEFGFDCKARKLSDKSISNYQKQLRYLLRYLEAEFQVNQVEEVRSFHIKQFLVDMADKGRKPQYINDLLKVFKTFFNYMKKEGYIKERPTASIHNMKQPKVKIITFSEDEIRKMLHYYQGRNFLNIRNRTMIALFFDTGMRLTEVMTLRPEQIREDSIIVHGKGNKERLVPVSAYLAKALMQYQMVREAYFEAKLPERYLFVSKNGRKLTQIKPLHLKRFLLMNESNELHVIKSPLRIIAGAFFMPSSSNTYLLRYLEAEFRVNQMEGVRTFHIKQFLVDMADKGRKPQYINDLLKGFSRKSVFTSAGP